MKDSDRDKKDDDEKTMKIDNYGWEVSSVPPAAGISLFEVAEGRSGVS